jgi:ElaB/YqjD/DUF883 family membrane-anchored ribosome-binding protein
MEVYFKQLISKDASLEKIVDDLERVVQGADDLAKSIGVNLEEHPRSEVARRLLELKENCQRISDEIIARAQATDRIVRKNPYSFIGAAVVLGVLVGAKLGARNRRSCD